MQHPKRACKSAKSYASHFTGLCCGVEYGGSMKVYAAIGRWLSGPAERIRPDTSTRTRISRAAHSSACVRRRRPLELRTAAA
jgi:hypothetical protein